VACLCVRSHLSVCPCLCVSFSVRNALTSEGLDSESLFLVRRRRYVFWIFGSRSHIKVIESRSRSHEQKNVKSHPATSFCDGYGVVSVQMQRWQVHSVIQVWRYLPPVTRGVAGRACADFRFSIRRQTVWLQSVSADHVRGWVVRLRLKGNLVLVRRYIFRIFRLNSYVKVIGSRSQEQKILLGIAYQLVSGKVMCYHRCVREWSNFDWKKILYLFDLVWFEVCDQKWILIRCSIPRGVMFYPNTYYRMNVCSIL